MRYLSFTYITFIILLFTLISSGLLFPLGGFGDKADNVPLGTEDQLSVRSGISYDGLVSVTLTGTAPAIPPRLKILNHQRTLRAFIGPSRVGNEVLYVEKIKPHEYFAVTGLFQISSEYSVFWSGSSTVVFFAVLPDASLVRMSVDLSSLLVSREVIDDGEGVNPDLHDSDREPQ